MSRLSIVAACLIGLAIPPAVRAQESLRPFSLGLQAGVNVADLSGSDKDLAPHDRFGFIGGGSVRLNPSRRFAIQLDVLYAQKGGEENTDRNPEDPADQFHIDYLELPLLFKIVLSSSRVRPELFVGPSVAFELNCTYDAFPDDQSQPAPCSDLGIETRSVDVGIAFGAGLDIPLASGFLTVDGRGIVGLRSIDASAANLDIRNRILALMVGYRFPL